MGSNDNNTMKCTKCHSAMTAGFLTDHYDRSWIEEYASQMEWVTGQPSEQIAQNLAGRARRMVTTYACNQCGFLESYVTPQGD